MCGDPGNYQKRTDNYRYSGYGNDADYGPGGCETYVSIKKTKWNRFRDIFSETMENLLIMLFALVVPMVAFMWFMIFVLPKWLNKY